ncbi:hypothetical protein Tco_0216329, partial [Tanacetum coccineum]
VMAFFVFSISSDSSEESVGTSTSRVILFGMIPTTIPPTTPTIDLPIIHDDTPLIPTDTPTISPIIPTIPHVAPTIQSRVAARSSPPPSHIRQILPTPLGLPRRLAILVLPRQPILIGRPYRTQPNGISSPQITHHEILHQILCQRLHQILIQSLHLILLRDIPYQVPYHITICSFTRTTLSLVRANLLSPRKRIRNSDSMTDLEVSSEDDYVPYIPIKVGLGVDVEDSYEPYTEPDVDSDIHADINVCIAFADDLRARGTDVKVVVKNAADEEVESSMRGTVEFEVDLRVRPVIDDYVRESVREDVPNHVTTDGAIEVTYETLGGLVQRFHDHTIEISAHRIQVIESV